MKLKIVSWFKKLWMCIHIHRIDKRHIYFPSKTNGKNYQLSYASASVAARFAHSWEHVTITRDDVLRDAGQEQEHFWPKATWLTFKSMKEC